MHISVMLMESIKALNIKSDGIYIDGTLGRAGHSSEIAKRLSTGRLIAFDKDMEAIEASREILGDNAILIHDSFATIEKHLEALNIEGVDGFLFDLGVSSPQFDDSKRGFSYRFDARLDMRMDQSQALSAYEVVNEYSEEALVQILKEYADERYAKGIVRNIVASRPVETTFELVECIKKAYPFKEMKKGHPGKKTFQAIRMEVNNELGDVKEALYQAIHKVNVGGRIVVITFHSIEDRLVKRIFDEVAKPKKVDPRVPLVNDEVLEFKWVKKGIAPSIEEIDENNRSHSARLRVIERIRKNG